MTESPVLWIVGWLFHLIPFLLVTLHSLRRRRNASATLLWIFIAWAVPILGPLIYLSFGIDRVPDRGLLKKYANQKLLLQRLAHQERTPHAHWHTLRGADPDTPFQKHLNRILDAILPDHPPLPGNQITPLVTGDEAYPQMLSAIRGAHHHIHLQSFILGNDAVGRTFMNALSQKAAEGVDIRLLYDRFGSTAAHLKGLIRKHRHEAHFHIAGWTQANFLKKQFQINLRNHRKALIVDGQHAFFGGLNLHIQNTSDWPKGPIRDYHFSAEGPLVQEFQYAFMRDWHFITSESADTLLTEHFFPRLPDTPAGNQVARLISSGPSTEHPVAIETFFSSITLARKQIIAVTPYFVPPPEIRSALRSAALRGLDVRLIVPQKNNHRYAGLASRALYQELLLSGIKIYERHEPFIHAKALLIDGECALVGTANLDERSLNLNYETTVAVYSESFVDRLKEIVFEEIELSDEVDLYTWQKRPAHQRLLENLASLMGPVL